MTITITKLYFLLPAETTASLYQKSDFLIRGNFDFHFYVNFTLFSLKLFTHIKPWCELWI